MTPNTKFRFPDCVDLQDEYGFYFAGDLQILDVYPKMVEKEDMQVLPGR